MHVGIMALCLERYTLNDSPVQKGLEAIERFAWSGEWEETGTGLCFSRVGYNSLNHWTLRC